MKPPKLYALCDKGLLDKFDISIDDFVQRALRHGAKVIQYRDKYGSMDRQRRALERLRGSFDGTLIINDNYALFEYCDGIHIGQEDLSNIGDTPQAAIKALRAKVSNKIIGLSTHNLKEVRVANSLDIDYIGVGAYRDTQTKTGVQLLEDGLDEIVNVSTKKIAVIGGVRLDDTIDGVEYIVVGSDLYR